MSTLSPEDTLKLLKYHKIWPDRERFANAPGEALVFLEWLKQNYSQASVVAMIQGDEGLEEFIHQYRHVLRPRERKSSPVNLRREPRIENQVGVLFKVASCPDDISVIGRSSSGKTLDVGLHGLRIVADKSLPKNGQIDITLTPKGFPITIYNLAADPKWVREEELQCLMGLSLSEVKDFPRWQEDFGHRFASTAARSL